MKKTIILVLLCVCTVFAFSQTQSKSRKAKAKPKLEVYYPSTYLFDEGTECYYVAGKYTHEELSNTEYLASLTGRTDTRSALESRCVDCTLKEYYELLDNLPIVNLPYWQNLRTTLKARIANQMEYERIYDESLVNPEVLNGTPYAAYIRYARILAKGTNAQIKDLWKECVDSIAKKNGYPENIYQKYREQQTSPDWLKYAKTDIIYIYYGETIAILSKINGGDTEPEGYHRFKDLFVNVYE